MGITGLLPYLENATRPCHISEFRGGCVAVDSYCYLHKGANACVESLARGEDNQMYVTYCIKYVKMLLSYNIQPIMVFDGRNLPAKAETEAKRRESRKKAKQRAAELLKLGKSEEARTYLKQSIDITPKMAHNLIKECRKLKVDSIVAPYESDAQMAFFNFKGVAECVITEDSDLVLFGCKKVLFKLDLGGAGRLVEAEKIHLAMKMRPDQFTFDKFRFMCILSGCDYVNSLSGIGLKKAEKFLKLTAETDPEKFLDRIPRYLNMKHLVITEDYKKSVLIAHATFLHQVVFDPYLKKLVHLVDPITTGTNPEYLVNCGDLHVNVEHAFEVAIGNRNPYTYEKIDNWSPVDIHTHSIWSGVYKKRLSVKQKEEIQKLNFRNYMKSNKDEASHHQDELLRIKEEDYEIQQELSVYLKPQINMKTEEKANVKEKDETESSEPSNKVSPVISKNPFLKKKLSKFPKTEASSKVIVTSRFFNSQSSMTESTSIKNTEVSPAVNDIGTIVNTSSTVEETTDESSSSIKEPNTLKNSSPDIFRVLDCDNLDNLPDTTNNENKLVLSISSEEVAHDISKFYEKTEETPFKKRPLDMEIDTVEEDIEKEEQAIETLCIDDDDAENEYSSKVSRCDSSSNKRRKLGPCKTVGLKKKVSGQKTLHSFFDKLKK